VWGGWHRLYSDSHSRSARARGERVSAKSPVHEVGPGVGGYQSWNLAAGSLGGEAL